VNSSPLLTTLQLQLATEELAAGQVTTDLIIRQLLKNITAIGIQVPGPFF
jgi:hypothetical protein